MRMNVPDENRGASALADLGPPSEWQRRLARCLLLVHPETVAFSAARLVASSSNAYHLEPEQAALEFIFEARERELSVQH